MQDVIKLYSERKVARIDTAKNLLYGIISKHSRNKRIDQLNKDEIPITGKLKRESEAKETKIEITSKKSLFKDNIISFQGKPIKVTNAAAVNPRLIDEIAFNSYTQLKSLDLS